MGVELTDKMAKGKKGDKKGGKEPEKTDDNSERKRSEKELILQKQLDELTTESAQLRDTLEQLRRDSQFLRQQIDSSVEEHTDYKLYMEKRNNDRSGDILSVNSKNRAELEQITQECKATTEHFNNRMEKLQDELGKKKIELKNVTEDLEKLDYIKIKEQEALERIGSLEVELESTRAKHSQDIQQMKAEFLKEKKGLSEQADQDILQLSKKATEVAANCLNQHAERVQKENQHLRTELLALLSESDQLQQRKTDLEQQYLNLIRENEYLDDLTKMRVN